MTTLEITDRAAEILAAAADRIVFPNGERDLNDDHHEAVTFIRSVNTLLRMGGRVWAESDTMLILDSTSGMTVGMHYDGHEWSTHT